MKHAGSKLLFLAALTATTIHLINRAEYSHSTIKNVLNSADNLYYEWRFGKIRYTKKGSGSPILLIHDLTVGSSLYEYSKLVNELSKKYEVYSIDLLGYGLSDKPNITYTNYLYVQMVTDFIKNVIGKKTDIISTGNSFPISVMVCHNDKECVKRLIGINPQSLFQANQIPSKQTRLLRIMMDTPILGTFIYNIHTNKNEMQKIFSDEYFFDSYQIEDKDVTAYVEAAHTTDYHSKHAHASLLGRYTNTNIIHALKRIDNSIYLIGGKNKDGIKDVFENYMYYNSAIESCYIDETKHLPHMEKPEEVIKSIDIYFN